MQTKLNAYAPYALFLLRVVAGYMFILHGTAKFFEFPISMTGGHGAVPLLSQFGIGGVIEIVFGGLFLLGLFTRVSAFLISGQMAFAYFFMHASAATLFLPLVNQGELALLYSVVFFLFVFTGAGKFALDNRFQRS